MDIKWKIKDGLNKPEIFAKTQNTFYFCFNDIDKEITCEVTVCSSWIRVDNVVGRIKDEKGNRVVGLGFFTEDEMKEIHDYLNENYKFPLSFDEYKISFFDKDMSIKIP